MAVETMVVTTTLRLASSPASAFMRASQSTSRMPISLPVSSL